MKVRFPKGLKQGFHLHVIGLVAVVVAGGATMKMVHSFKKRGLTKKELASVLGEPASFHQLPSEVELTVDGDEKNKVPSSVEYTFDPKLQGSMENLFRAYKPDYGAFVAIDATTGRVLSMVSYSRKSETDNLALRATFPSASVFKVVTAAAAIERERYSANTVIPFNGQNHTLYRGNVLRTKVTRWTRYTTLKDAFAKSINTVFAKIGAFSVGPDNLREYAGRFGFNRRIACDIQFQEGHALIPDDAWGLAEAASGFTRDNTMSPMQGALIAAAIVNDGVMMEPYVVQTITRKTDNQILYTGQPTVGTQTVDPTTAAEIRQLMNETVRHGTSRGSFRGFFRRDLADLNVGGKTGSLTGTSPRGKYDWFVGFAEDGQNHRIAVATLTVSEKFWRVKSSYLSRKAMETYFRDIFSRNQVAMAR